MRGVRRKAHPSRYFYVTIRNFLIHNFITWHLGGKGRSLLAWRNHLSGRYRFPGWPWRGPRLSNGRGDRRGCRWLVGADTRELRHSLDIGCGMVLDRRRPLGDDFTDGKQSVGVVIHAGKQPEGSSPPPLHALELTERSIVLLGTKPLPLSRTATDIQWITITYSSRCCSHNV